MKIPALYYALAAAVLAAMVAIVVAVKQHDRRVAEQAAAHALIVRDSGLIASYAKRLKSADSATLHNIGATRAAITVYDTIRIRMGTTPRIRVDTVRERDRGIVRIDTVEVVPPGYVKATDAAIKQCKLLEASCGEFRLYADSTMAAQTRIIEQLRIVGKPSGSRLGLGAFAGVCTDKKPCAGVGAMLKVF